MVAKDLEDDLGFGERQDANREYYEALQQCVHGIQTTLRSYSTLIATLRENYEQLQNKVKLLEAKVVSYDNNRRNVSHSNELVLSGVPPDCALSPQVILKKVFEALDIGRLSVNVLTVRKMVKGGEDHSGDQSQDLYRAPYAVLLVSDVVRDFVLRKRRARKNFVWSEVLEDCSPAFQQSTVYLNEMLPPATYRLLRQARRNMKHSGYSHVWPSNGHIYARKSHGQPRIILTSIDDMVA